MKIFCVSLGCDKNLVDTEMMLGLLNKDGYTFTDDEHEADVVVVNTCCFIGDAKEESVNTILEMAELKKEGRCKALIVTGCMAQRYKQEILDEIPEVDGILGTSTYDEISNVLKKVLGGSRESCFHDLNALPNVEVPRVVTTGGYYAFLKIAEGCDKRCTYCIIPDLRGSYRSVPMERLIEEAKQLASRITAAWGADSRFRLSRDFLALTCCAVPRAAFMVTTRKITRVLSPLSVRKEITAAARRIITRRS